MKLLQSLLLMGVLVGMGTGCATTKQVVSLPDQTQPVSSAEKARVYVFRRTGLSGAGMPATVLDNGTKIGSMGWKGYLCWERDPGTPLISIIWPGSNPIEKRVQFEAGHTYYLKHGVVGFIAASTLTVMTEAEGETLLTKSKAPQLKGVN